MEHVRGMSPRYAMHRSFLVKFRVSCAESHEEAANWSWLCQVGELQA